MTIAIDIDDVLSDTFTNFIAYYDRKEGIALEKKDFMNYPWIDKNGDMDKRMAMRAAEFIESGLLATHKPIRGSRQAVASLAKEHILIPITSRDLNFKPATIDWVEKYFPNQFKRIFFSSEIPSQEILGGKGDVCRHIGAEILIDDYQEYIIDADKHGIKGIIFTQPWNLNQAENSNIKRANNWAEVARVIDEWDNSKNKIIK